MAINYTEYDKLLADLLSSDNDTAYKIIRGELNQHAGSIHTDEKTYIIFYPDSVQWIPVMLHARWDTVLPLEKINIMLDVYGTNKNCPVQDFANRAGVYVILKVLRKLSVQCPVMFTSGKTVGMNNAISSSDILDSLEGNVHAILDTTLPATNLYNTAEKAESVVAITDVLNREFVRQQSVVAATSAAILGAEYNIPTFYLPASVHHNGTYSSVEKSFCELTVEKLCATLPYIPYISTYKHIVRAAAENIYGTAAIDTLVEDFNFDETPRCSVCGKRKFPQTYFHQAGNLCRTCESKVRKESKRILGTDDVTLEGWFGALNVYMAEKVVSKLGNLSNKVDVSCTKCGSNNLYGLGHGEMLCKDCNTQNWYYIKEGQRGYIDSKNKVVYVVAAKERKIINMIPNSITPPGADKYMNMHCALCNTAIGWDEGPAMYSYKDGAAVVCQKCNSLLKGDI